MIATLGGEVVEVSHTEAHYSGQKYIRSGIGRFNRNRRFKGLKPVAEARFALTTKGVIVPHHAVDVDSMLFTDFFQKMPWYVSAGSNVAGILLGRVEGEARWHALASTLRLVRQVFLHLSIGHLDYIAIVSALVGRCAASVGDGHRDADQVAVSADRWLTHVIRHVGPEFTPGRIPRDPIRIQANPERTNHAERAYYPSDTGRPCPPCAVRGRVCGFPLGTQISVTAVFALAAWFFFFVCAFSPFFILIIARRDVFQACGYGLLSGGLFSAAFWTGMIGSS